MFEPGQLNKIDKIQQLEREKEQLLTAKERQELMTQEIETSKKVLEEERIYRRGVVSIRDLIAPAALEVNSSFIKLGDYYVKTIFVIEYPRYISVGWFAPIINMDVTADLALYFYPVKASVILKQLKKKVGALQAGLISDAEKGAPRDPLRETALRDMEKLRDDLTQGVEHFFQTALYITIYGRSLEELDNISEAIENTLGSALIYSKRVFYQAEQGFNSTLPLAADDLQILTNMNTSPAASSFPFVSSDLTSDSGVLFGINRHNNS